MKEATQVLQIHYYNIRSSPLTTQEDRDYLIDAINYMFPSVNVTDEDIESTWGQELDH